MREAAFVGVTADGTAILVRVGDEHLTLPLDERLRQAVTTPTMQLPLQPESVTPREAQHRMRCGESAVDIAASAGVPVEIIARYEGPVLDERRWQAERARRTAVGGVTLEERLAAAVSGTTGDDRAFEATWEAWLDGDDGLWRIRAVTPDGRVAVWSWDAKTAHLRGADDLARLALTGRVVVDDLEAVLRPLAAMRTDATPEPPAPEPPAALPAEPEPDPDEEPGPAAKTKRRKAVPAWDDILFGSKRKEGADPE